MQSYLLSSLIFVPLLALIVLLFLPASQKGVFKISTLIITGIQMILTVVIYATFQRSIPKADFQKITSFQFVEFLPWIELDLGNWGKLSIDYILGVDGLSVSMVLLAGIVMFLGAISSWNLKNAGKGYFLLYLLLSSSVMGCFVALDFFLFYLFFEFMLLPMYFLIGIWGGERKEYAAIKFFIYTLVGSLFILVVMIGLYLSVIDPVRTLAQNPDIQGITALSQAISKGEIETSKQVHTFQFIYMLNPENYLPESLMAFGREGNWRVWAFWALMIGFLIKLPSVPVHTWLPDAHVEAPTPISVVLAGILLKIGGYGMLRIAYGFFPQEAIEYAPWVAGLGVLSIIYGALNALAMSDLKKMIAYSSVSHMGFVLLGVASITPEGINGAVYQMFSHGILSAMLFLLVGVLYDRTHNRLIDNYRGLFSQMPYYTVFIMIGFFASLGLPGFSGFIGELFTLLGGFGSDYLSFWFSVWAVIGIVLGAAYFLWTLQRMFFGEYWLREETWQEKIKDLDTREWAMLLSLSILALAFGLFPNLLFDTSNQTVNLFVNWLISNKP